jgi:DNA-binding CsgD family transcriptional regulator
MGLALFAAISILLLVQLTGEMLDDEPSESGDWLESGVLVIALLGTALLGCQSYREREHSQRTLTSLRAASSSARQWQAEAERWRAEAQQSARGLAESIDRQFNRWALTAAEKEVALLILKGLSHKEIAAVRDVSERTVRQQAWRVYQAAGLAGRAELAAFFLEDLLLPADQRDKPASESR